MKIILSGLAAAACFPASLLAQEKVNPTDPQPTCHLCPGTYIPLSELDAYTKKAIAEKLIDQQVRDIISGAATLVLGPDILERERRPATMRTVVEFNGPGNNGSDIRNGVAHQVKA